MDVAQQDFESQEGQKNLAEEPISFMLVLLYCGRWHIFSVPCIVGVFFKDRLLFFVLLF